MEGRTPDQDPQDRRPWPMYIEITLLSVSGKVLNKITLQRLKGPVDLRLSDQQADFRPGRSCTDQITTLPIDREVLG